MQKVILALEKEGIKDFWAVHDSFGVHACHIDKLREIVNQTFVDLHKEPLEHHLKKIIDLNSDILSADFLADNKEQNLLPKNHTNNWINDVLEAEFLIS
jgi:DNA-directed RNA polymerase